MAAAVRENVTLSKPKAAGKLLRKPRPSKLNPLVSYHDLKQHKPVDTMELIKKELHQLSAARISPAPSVVPSLASPTPSMTQSERDIRSHISHTYSDQIQLRHYVSDQDRQYILDPKLFRRDPSQTGPIVTGESLIKPQKPRGPDSLPARIPKQCPAIDYKSLMFNESEERYIQPPKFTLNNFVYQMADVEKLSLDQVKKAVLSKYNYKRLTKLLMEKLHPKQCEVKSKEMKLNDKELPNVNPRVPQKQLILEMAAIVREQMKKYMNSDVKSIIKSLPKYHPNLALGTGPHTEILLYEDDTRSKSRQAIEYMQNTEQPAQDALFHSSNAKYFQGSKRSSSPFAAGEDGIISPAELAILDSLLSGGTALSLKAHFIGEMPDVSPLIHSVTYVNLSFNDFRIFPSEIYELRQLEILKLRNNPLSEIPHEIYKLRNLHTLVCSFCLLSNLPMSLYKLKKLKHLDLSFNKISFLPNEIKNLTNLKELLLEGNQLAALPAGVLNLKLSYLRVRNNYMHPLFWRENTQNQPQRLTDLSALAFSNARFAGVQHIFEDIPENIQLIIMSHRVCDCCKGQLYGPGLRIIRPASKLFGVKNLPFLFNSCSSYCARLFMESTDALAEILYERDERVKNELET